MKGYYLFPDIRENLITFTSDDDVWLFDGENVKRLTSGSGVAIRPKISPDGRKVAFTMLWLKNGKSGGDIFVTDGNEVKRVTFFNSSVSRVSLWSSPEEVIIITDFHTPFQTIAYKVNINTGEYQRLPYGIVSNVYIKDRITILARGYQDLPFWKGYKGGTKGELWISYDGGKSFKKFVSLDGSVSWPMIIKERVYFLSDHEGVANLYSVDLNGGDLTKHTNFDTYCRNASSDGKRVVFQNMGDIYLFDPETNEVRKLEIELVTDRKKRQPRFVNAMDYLTETTMSSEYIGIVSRGKVFVMRPWDGPAVQLGGKQGVKYSNLQLLNDSAVVSDDNDNVLILSLQGEKKIGQNFGRVEKIKISPDGKKLLIANNKLELWLYDLEKNVAKLVDKSDYGLLSDFDWHPNSEWFAYSFAESHATRSIKLGNLDGTVVRVTSPYGYDFSPSFDPDGRYLYFLSARHLEPSSDKVVFNMSFQKVVKPYLVVLTNDYSPFNQPLMKSDSKKGVELTGISDRVVPFPIEEDNYVRIEGAKNNKVFLFSYPIKGTPSLIQDMVGKLDVFDIENKTKDPYLDNVKDFTLSPDKSKILVMLKDSMRLYDVSAKPELTAQGRKGGVIDLSRVKVYVEPEKEWRQMLRETWKLMKQNYWNEKELKDWDSVLPKYEKLLDRISTRYELGDLIQEMQGETRTSHSYHTPYSYDTDEPIPIGGLGADVEFNGNCFKVIKIYSGDPINENERSPLRDPGVQIEEGDCIVAIDGEPVSYGNIYYYLLNKDSVRLDVITKNGEKKTVYVKLMKDEKFLIYRDWVERNRKYVHEKTNGRVGYVHIPDMMYQGFSEFYRLFLSEFDKEALIIDARFNRGGFVSGLILQRLLLKRMGFVVPRNGKAVPEPYFSSPNLMVEVVNEYAGSDGDIFTHLFKKFKLGIVIGRRTWGGVIGISPRVRLADKTQVTQPEYAVHFYDVGLGIENRGVDPDIEVDIPPGVEGDPQLDKAIEILTSSFS